MALLQVRRLKMYKQRAVRDKKGRILYEVGLVRCWGLKQRRQSARLLLVVL
jgi:hypothetical protein